MFQDEDVRENLLAVANAAPGRLLIGYKAAIEASLSKYLDEVRNSAKADGQERIFIHGEKEAEARGRVLKEGVYLNDKTYAEMQMIAEYTGSSKYLPEYLD